MPTSKTKPCLFFMKGHCKTGASCPFQHTSGMPPPASIKEQCRYFSHRDCAEGDLCPYLHGTRDSRLVAAVAAKKGAPSQISRMPVVKPINPLSRSQNPLPPAAPRPPTMATWDFRDEEEDGVYFYGSGPTPNSQSAYRTSSDGPAPVLLPQQPRGPRWSAVASNPMAAEESSGIRNANAGVTDDYVGGIDESSSDFVDTGSGSGRSRVAVPCQFFFLGECRYGDTCRFSHACSNVQDPACQIGDLSLDEFDDPRDAAVGPLQGEEGWDLGHPISSATTGVAAAAAAAAAATGIESNDGDNDDMECGICFSDVTDSFGLLDGCDHAFCLECIRGWREKGLEGGASETVRRCPVCRIPCFLVIPSPIKPRDAASKQGVVSTYKASLRKIPCRHFQNGRGECPFGTSCLYAHLLPDGQTPAPPLIQRTLKTGDGHATVVGSLTLGDFL